MKGTALPIHISSWPHLISSPHTHCGAHRTPIAQGTSVLEWEDFTFPPFPAPKTDQDLKFTLFHSRDPGSSSGSPRPDALDCLGRAQCKIRGPLAEIESLSGWYPFSGDSPVDVRGQLMISFRKATE